jgi:hypothetical protein
LARDLLISYLFYFTIHGMSRLLKRFSSDPEYWSQVVIALAQVTFGVAWATFFLPFDASKVFVLVLNIVATALLLLVGVFIRRKNDE